MNLEKYKKRERQNVKDATLQSRLSPLKQFDEFLQHDDEPSIEEAEEWVERLIEKFENGEISSATVNQYYKAVRYYFEIMHGNSEELDHISKWTPTEDNDHGDFLEHDEWELLRGYAFKPRTSAIIECMYRYGRRPGEVRLLNLSDVNFNRGTIIFPILKKQETLRANFKLLDDTRAELDNYLNYRVDKEVEGEHPWEDDTVKPLFTTGNGRISYDTIWVNVKKVTDRAGIDKNITPKSMRHSRATHLDWAGEDPESIARHQLIHEPDTQVIGAYIHDRDASDVREPMVLEDE